MTDCVSEENRSAMFSLKASRPRQHARQEVA